MHKIEYYWAYTDPEALTTSAAVLILEFRSILRYMLVAPHKQRTLVVKILVSH